MIVIFLIVGGLIIYMSNRLGKFAEESAIDKQTVEAGAAEEVKCPKCLRTWDKIPCEQSVAIEKRGKCIVCISLSGESICSDPYEFAYPGHEDWIEKEKP